MTPDTDLATQADRSYIAWLETELARLREECEGYKRDFLAASERCGMAEKERDRLQLMLRAYGRRVGVDGGL